MSALLVSDAGRLLNTCWTVLPVLTNMWVKLLTLASLWHPGQLMVSPNRWKHFPSKKIWNPRLCLHRQQKKQMHPWRRTWRKLSGREKCVCVCEHTCTCRTDVNVLASSATPPMYRDLVKTGWWSFSSLMSMMTLAVLARTHRQSH